MHSKEHHLTSRLKELKRVAVAFSGGVDSSLLAYCASLALPAQAFALTIWSPLLSKSERDDIRSFTEKYGIPLIRVEFDETRDDNFSKNSSERCYRCKSLRLEMLEKYAREWGIPWILDGSNTDDLNDYRPGMRALAESKMTLSPLLECGFSKEDVRALSRHYGLSTAEKPASACLASRIPTEVQVKRDLLAIIDKGEEILRSYLPKNAQARLRFDGKKAVIETEKENIAQLSDIFDSLKERLLVLGIEETSIASEGYRMGSVSRRT